jgi:23S rRNA pseudouridine1911/1915/1917 synthase
MELTLTVGADGAAVRLDTFLHEALRGCSRRAVRRVIAAGEVRVNGRPARKGTRLRAGDRVTAPALPAHIAAEPEIALPIVYEDDQLIVMDKPGGMPSHALDARERGTAAAFVVTRHPETAAIGDPLAPGLVHRLDTGTSGVLVAARTSEAHAKLRAALRARQVEKVYLALVQGDAHALDGVHIGLALAHDPHDRRRMVPAAPGLRTWPAETSFVVRQARPDRSLVEATIRTGVTHQVRVHLAHAGHPVLGDIIYGGAPAELPAGRHALHASRVTLPHPADGRSIAVSAPFPADLRALM